MLVSEPALNRVIDDVKLGSTDFYLDRHKAIYEVMLDLYSADKPCDELTVNEALAGSNKVDEAGGKDYVSELAAKVPDPGNVYHYAEIVKDPKVHALIKPFFDELNKSLANYESIKRFAILPQDLTLEAGDLTPSLKLKRKAVEGKYKDLLDGFYAGGIAEV
mgnify:CR=1 FL=1